MMIHEITEKAGAHKKRKRIGRGPGSGYGKTSGRGHKGASSRSGAKRRASSEGGQMPFFRRFAKRGFSNANFSTRYETINLRLLENRFDDGADITPDSLSEKGLLKNVDTPVKILGEGQLTKKFSIRVSAASKSEIEKVKAAGGNLAIAPK